MGLFNKSGSYKLRVRIIRRINFFRIDFLYTPSALLNENVGLEKKKKKKDEKLFTEAHSRRLLRRPLSCNAVIVTLTMSHPRSAG